MIAYLIKSTVCLLLLYGVYRIFLEAEKMHRFNRYFLLFSLVLGLTVPLLTIEVEGQQPTRAQLSQQLDKLLAKQNQPVAVPEANNSQEQSKPAINQEKKASQSTFTFSIIPVLKIAYLVIALVMLTRFLTNLYTLLAKAKRNKQQTYKNATLVLVEDCSVPYSFLKYIFIDKRLFESGNVNTSILEHELKHTQDKHSLDIIFVEVLKILFWFNPALYLFKKAIQLNHEFLADESVVQSSQNTPDYQKLLLKINNNKHEFSLASSINYSITKKRLVMMTKKASRLRNVTKQITLIPLVAALVFAFSNKAVNAQSVEEMSLSELIAALSAKVDATDSFSSDEQKALSELVKKLRIKMPPPPPKPKKVKTPPPPPVKIDTEKLMETNKKYNTKVKAYNKIPATEENKNKLHKEYTVITKLKIQLDQLYEETYAKVKNPPPPPPRLRMPETPGERLSNN